MIKGLKVICGLFIIACIWAIIRFVCILKSNGIALATDGVTLDLENTTGPIGDFVGGVFGTLLSFISILLVLLTMREQREQYQKDRFVQTFYEMLHIHNDNVKGLSIRKDNKDYTGHEVFSVFVNRYKELYRIVRSYTDNIQIRGLEGCTFSNACKELLNNEEKRSRLEMRLVYGYFFFGTDDFRLRKPSKEEMAIENHVRSMFEYNHLGHNGYSGKLGHYYRHMYQIVSMVAKTNCLDEKEKYSYTRQLRACLDSDEQLLFYYNAMSDVGYKWIQSSRKPVYEIEDMCLITRFRLIKNITLSRFSCGLNPKVVFAKEINIWRKKEMSFFELDN